jgi:hypothetical protein
MHQIAIVGSLLRGVADPADHDALGVADPALTFRGSISGATAGEEIC